MSESGEPGSRRGRVHDAQGAREAILNAAEAVFAEHGFDGARVDAIAQVSGYNKSLLFQYFGDKLGLYAEVLKRVDKQSSELQAQLLGPLLEDETITTDAQRFRAFLKTAIGVLFDYMLEHPRVMRMLVWEQAEGWQTFAKIVSQFETGDIAQLEALFARARRAGLLRSDFDPVVLLFLAEQICWLYPTSLPFYQMFLPDRDFSSAAALAHAREQIIEFIVAGMTVDPPETKP